MEGGLLVQFLDLRFSIASLTPRNFLPTPLYTTGLFITHLPKKCIRAIHKRCPHKITKNWSSSPCMQNVRPASIPLPPVREGAVHWCSQEFSMGGLAADGVPDAGDHLRSKSLAAGGWGLGASVGWFFNSKNAFLGIFLSKLLFEANSSIKTFLEGSLNRIYEVQVL